VSEPSADLAEPDHSDLPGDAPVGPPSRRWLRVVPGAALVGVVVYVVARTWDALVANNPAYPLSLLLAAAVGLWLLVTGLRRGPAPRGGRMRTTLRVAAALGGVGVAALLLWLMPFVASDAALTALVGSSSVTVTDSRTHTLYEPATAPKAGLVLYPGARVDPRAYAVLATDIAAHGYRVVVPKCPYDLQLLCPNAAASYIDDTMPWAVGGHSLGGVAASTYAAGDDRVKGLVLWGSYPVQDLSGHDLAVASISGSQDGLSTPAKVAEHWPLLPPRTVRTQIQGGIHSYFGDYGLQPGDGTATVDRATAQKQIVAATVALLESIAHQSP
jgi:hypothetical protein